MLTPNGKKQEISILYLHALTTHCGYSLEITRIDMDSVDATICAKGRVEGSKEDALISPKIDIQLKATSRSCSKDIISFPLPKKNYEELRARTMVPRILIVVFLPDEKSCFEFDLEKISVYAEGYWMSLKGMGESDNNSSITIHLPDSQRIAENTIQQLIIAAANREEFSYAVSC